MEAGEGRNSPEKAAGPETFTIIGFIVGLRENGSFHCGAEDNALYLYDFKGFHYYAVRGFAHDREWLVIFGQGGVMETAFPPEETDDYLERRGFVFLGRLGEVLRWTE